jgi:transcriptional regulator with XRE-family HTH domain
MSRGIIDGRLAKKWTQVQLAHNAAVDVKTIGEIERGGCIYDATIFNKLCKALGIMIERNFVLEQKK